MKILKSYNDAPHFSDSIRDVVYEIALDDKTKVSVIRCEDKHSRKLGMVEILSVKVGEETYYGSKHLADLKIDAAELEEQIQTFLENNA